MIESWIQDNITYYVPFELVISILQNHPYTLVSDRFYFPNNLSLISATWILVCNTQVTCIGKLISEVKPDLRSSYAAELCGVLSFYLFLKHIYNSLSSTFQISLVLEC